MGDKVITLAYTPFTGLGLYNGFRGNAWLENRIKIFKQLVIPSWKAQTSQDFVHWISWRPEEKSNPYVKELGEWLTKEGIRFKFTFNGICFYDDKFEDSVARQRLINNVHYTIGELYDTIGEAGNVIMMIAPSDDLYEKNAVETIQYLFEHEDWGAVGFSKGYICNYKTKEVAEYNPLTNPPFYSIKFTREQFTNPLAHVAYTSMKKDVGKYKVGTPLPSHEYVGDCLKYYQIDERGFLVGTGHGANISTGWNIPYKGEAVSQEVLKEFGVYDVEPIKLRIPLRKRLLFSLPYKLQRKLRYWFTEKYAKPT